ncbi:MAG TPA: SMP-30/gluconolactonase/LRE family protein [Flavitalea sp.]|nr:SMP-30/gluconolactonase/LRE family protein [Flavitalea sp.]
MTGRYLPLFFLALVLSAVVSCGDQPPAESGKTTAGAEEQKVVVRIERTDPAINAIISEETTTEVIAEGFAWSEGPVWVEAEQMLLFSDVPNNIIYKWTAEGGKQIYLSPSGYTDTVSRGGEMGSNGLFLNNSGQLVLCQHGDRRLALMNAPLNDPRPEFISIADNYRGKKFDSPNDGIVLRNGDYFFTDPPYGLPGFISDPGKAAPYQGVYKVSGGTVTLLTDSITRPNGIAAFPDERSIIVANSDENKAAWYLYDLDEKNEFTNARIFYDATADAKKEKGSPDGLKIDRQGNVFATGPGGIWIFNEHAKALGKIKIDQPASNCALADDDKTLYITAGNYILRLKLR